MKNWPFIKKYWVRYLVIVSFCLIVLATVGLLYVRKLAYQWTCANTIRALGSCLLMYADENGGFLPPDQGTLATSMFVTAPVFVYPSFKCYPELHIPFAQLSQWVNLHSDFIYDVPGINVQLNRANDGQIVAMHEKEAIHHGEGVNVVFLDDHVEWMSIEDARMAIALSKSKLAATQPATNRVADK